MRAAAVRALTNGLRRRPACCPPTRHSAGVLAGRSRRSTLPGSRFSSGACSQAHAWAAAGCRRNGCAAPRPPCAPRLRRVAAAPAPVRGQAAQDGVGHHGGKGQVQQARAVRHANLEAQAERLLGDRHDARHLGLHLAALEVEAQAYRLPGSGQFAADDLRPRWPGSTPRCRSARAAGPSLPSPPSSRSIMGGASARSSCRTESAPSGSRRTEAT